MDYSTFFEVADLMQTSNAKSYKLYYDDKGAIIDICYDIIEGNYIEISQTQFDACNQKRGDYSVIDGKLEFTPPKQRTWNLTQDELERNPYIWNK